jgi:hypothetical protein
MITDVRTWLRAPDHSIGLLLLVLGMALATSALTLMFGG